MAFTPHFKVRLLNKQHPQPYRLINEAFVVFDTMVARVALTRGGNTPPAAPVNGEVHIIGTAPVDIWAGMGACITYYFNGWQFIAPPPGMKMWVVEEGIFITYTGTLWSVDAGTSDAQNDQTSTLSGSSTLLSSDSQQPSIITEWLDPDGTRVAPFTGTARECVVVYLMDGERRILTPFSDYHFRAPRLAYGGKSVIAWRVANGAEDKTGKRFAISVGCPGFMAPDDPNLLHVWMCDGQSLAVGSQGSDEYPWRTKNNWPEHLLVLQNTMIPGDSRLGRDAQKVDYVLSRETLTGFTPVSPRVGFRRNHGFTPLEGLALTMQHDIVEKLGRPQRIALAILGIGGAAIAALSPGAENYKNYETVMDAMVEEAAVRGWKVSFDFDLWIQGESDVGGVNGSSAAYRSVYDARLDAIRAKASAISGTKPLGLVFSLSSFPRFNGNGTAGNGPLGLNDAFIERPDIVRMIGPHYPVHKYYKVGDYVHFTGAGYFRLGEMARDTVWKDVWGTGGADPLYLVSATYSPGGMTITLNWSRPITRDNSLGLEKPFDGLELATESGTFKPLVSHTITDGSPVSTITLAAALTASEHAAARILVGLSGQCSPRQAAEVSATSIRATTPHDIYMIDHVMQYRYAIHQRCCLKVIDEVTATSSTSGTLIASGTSGTLIASGTPITSGTSCTFKPNSFSRLAPLLTAVLPTHNRPQYLERASLYYRNVPFRVIVVDSSDSPYEGLLPRNFEYHFHQGWPFCQKVSFGIDAVKTPYCMMINDDDFFFYSALDREVEFLEANPSYGSAQGYYMAKLPLTVTKVLAPMYATKYAFRIDADDPGGRLLQLKSKYFHTSYSVHRTCNLQPILERGKFLVSPFALEFLVANGSVALGKHIMLPHLHCVRDACFTSSTGRDPHGFYGLNKLPSRMREVSYSFYALQTLLRDVLKIDNDAAYAMVDRITPDTIESRTVKERTAKPLGPHPEGVPELTPDEWKLMTACASNAKLADLDVKLRKFIAGVDDYHKNAEAAPLSDALFLGFDDIAVR